MYASPATLLQPPAPPACPAGRAASCVRRGSRPPRTSHGPRISPRSLIRIGSRPRSGGLELADDGGHGGAGADELVGSEGDAADRGVAATAEPGAERADVVAAALLAPGVDADGDLDAVGVAGTGDGVEAARVELV